MAFNVSYWNAGTPSVQSTAVGRGDIDPGIANRTYYTSDTKATVFGAGYFNEVYDDLNSNDLIYVSGPDEAYMVYVSAKSSNVITITPEERSTEQEGVINAKDYGAVGDGTTDDSGAINAALAAAEANGSGEVFVPHSASGYYCGSSISVPTFVSLKMSPWTTIKTDQNSLLLDVQDHAIVDGGVWLNTNASLTSTTPIVQQELSVNPNIGAERKWNWGLSNMTIQGASTSNRLGRGLVLSVPLISGDSAAIQWGTFSNLRFFGLHSGLVLTGDEDTGETNFINGNSFNSLFFANCVKGIDFIDVNVGGGQVSFNENTFNGIIFQTNSSSTDVIDAASAAAVKGNVFNGITVFDWGVAAETVAITFGGQSSLPNAICGLSGLYDDEITLSTGNLLSPDTLPTGPR